MDNTDCIVEYNQRNMMQAIARESEIAGLFMAIENRLESIQPQDEIETHNKIKDVKVMIARLKELSQVK